MFDAAIEFWRQHIILANFSHAAGGFGLALVLQSVIGVKPFIRIFVGWLLLGFCIVAHLMALGWGVV